MKPPMTKTGSKMSAGQRISEFRGLQKGFSLGLGFRGVGLTGGFSLIELEFRIRHCGQYIVY